jgi:hypothetical protein
MRSVPGNDVFKPNLSRQETKSDMTTKVAQQIIDSEATARAAKTERLRAARLARDADAEPQPVKAKVQRKR